MALTDDQLLDFDSRNYQHYNEDDARESLAGQHAEIFRAQLASSLASVGGAAAEVVALARELPWAGARAQTARVGKPLGA